MYYIFYHILIFLAINLSLMYYDCMKNQRKKIYYEKTLPSKLVNNITVCIVIVLIIVISIIFLLSKKETYRSIAVDNLLGTSLITNEKSGEIEAYKGMRLYSNDYIAVQKEANLTLCVDSDKYIYAKENTGFKVVSTENNAGSKLVIHLDEGSVLHRLKNPLKDGESYTLEAPNATMGVRGTVFRVTLYKAENELNYTLVEVFDGKVQVDLKTENGVYNGLSTLLEPGESTLIRGNAEFAEFVENEEVKEKHEISYKQIPQDVAKVLVEYIDDGEELCIGKELLMDYTGLAEHKMENIVEKKATCTEDGYKELKCVVCNELTDTIVLPATGHTLADWEIAEAPTCLQTGTKKSTCSTCKTYYEEEIIAALGHIKGDLVVTKDANCTNEGVQTATCTRCKEVVEEVKIAALGHSYASPVTVDPTCTTDGSTTTTCSKCGEKSVSVIAATGHNMRKIHDNFTGGNDTGISTAAICHQTCRVCRVEIETPCSLTLVDDSVNVDGIRVITYSCSNCGIQISTRVI